MAGRGGTESCEKERGFEYVLVFRDDVVGTYGDPVSFSWCCGWDWASSGSVQFGCGVPQNCIPIWTEM